MCTPYTHEIELDEMKEKAMKYPVASGARREVILEEARGTRLLLMYELICLHEGLVSSFLPPMIYESTTFIWHQLFERRIIVSIHFDYRLPPPQIIPLPCSGPPTTTQEQQQQQPPT
jgi:hypothetical protein